jgi:hypothetical protein
MNVECTDPQELGQTEALRLAERFLNGDAGVIGRFSPAGRGSFLFAERGSNRWAEVFCDQLVVPEERNRIVATLLHAEIARRAWRFDVDVRERDPQLLAEDVVLAGDIDSALALSRARREVPAEQWLAARDAAFEALEVVLRSLDTVGDRPQLASELRAVMVLESFNRPAVRGTCRVCHVHPAKLAAPSVRGGSIRTCVSCFVERKYLPEDHQPLAELEMAALTAEEPRPPAAGRGQSGPQ